MTHCYCDELEVKDVQKVALVFFDFDLLDEGFQKDLNGDALILLDDVAEVPQHELPDVEFLVVLDE